MQFAFACWVVTFFVYLWDKQHSTAQPFKSVCVCVCVLFVRVFVCVCVQFVKCKILLFLKISEAILFLKNILNIILSLFEIIITITSFPPYCSFLQSTHIPCSFSNSWPFFHSLLLHRWIWIYIHIYFLTYSTTTYSVCKMLLCVCFQSWSAGIR